MNIPIPDRCIHAFKAIRDSGTGRYYANADDEARRIRVDPSCGRGIAVSRKHIVFTSNRVRALEGEECEVLILRTERLLNETEDTAAVWGYYTDYEEALEERDRIHSFKRPPCVHVFWHQTRTKILVTSSMRAESSTQINKVVRA